LSKRRAFYFYESVAEPFFAAAFKEAFYKKVGAYIFNAEVFLCESHLRPYLQKVVGWQEYFAFFELKEVLFRLFRRGEVKMRSPRKAV